MRSMSAGGPAYIGGPPPPIPPLPVGYASMHYNPNMVSHPAGQPSMVLVPQPYHPGGQGHHPPSQIQHIHAPYQHPAHLHPLSHSGSKHHQHHVVEQMIPNDGKNLAPQPPTRNAINNPKSNNAGSASNRYHSLQYDSADNSHPKAARKVSGGNKNGILKDP